MAIVAIKELKAALPAKSRLLGIDHGSKTLGLALANPALTMATPLKTIARTKFTENLRELAVLCKDYEIGGFVIGLPYNMDGTEGPRAQSVRHFGFNLLKDKDKLGFEPVIAFFDERLSTYAAEQMLIDDLNMRRDKRKEIIDAMAAAQILQGALDALNKEP
jgi:putative Holliday junction resolvase